VAPALAAQGVLTAPDMAALAVYCQAFARWRSAERALARMRDRDAVTEGLAIQGAHGNIVSNPLVRTARDAMDGLLKAAAEFGMTPSARSRVKATREQEEANPFLRNGKRPS